MFAVFMIDVNGATPAFNVHWHQTSLLFEALDGSFGIGLAEAEIIGDPFCLNHAKGLYGIEHELVMSISHGYLGQFIEVREHALAQVIDALEVVAFADHQFAGIEQILQRNLLFLPIKRSEEHTSELQSRLH